MCFGPVISAVAVKIDFCMPSNLAYNNIATLFLLSSDSEF